MTESTKPAPPTDASDASSGLGPWPGVATAAVAAVFTLLAPAALAGCSDSAAAELNYAVDGVLNTYNANTVTGAASAGPQAFARTLTGFSLHGQRNTRLIVPDMQATTARFKQLAEEKGGSYDGWAVAKKRQ